MAGDFITAFTINDLCRIYSVVTRWFSVAGFRALGGMEREKVRKGQKIAGLLRLAI